MVVDLVNLNLILVPTNSKSRALRPKLESLHSTLSHVNRTSTATRRMALSVRNAADDNSLNSDGGSGTRLVRTIQAFQLKLVTKLKNLTNKLPLKIFSLLVGFYCATAFATVIGQTGDWDVLSAALAVAVVEGEARNAEDWRSSLGCFKSSNLPSVQKWLSASANQTCKGWLISPLVLRSVGDGRSKPKPWTYECCSKMGVKWKLSKAFSRRGPLQYAMYKQLHKRL